jgi:hypothetical protein
MSRTVRHRDKARYWRKASGTSRKARHRRDVADGVQAAFESRDRRAAGGEAQGEQHAPIAEPASACREVLAHWRRTLETDDQIAAAARATAERRG